MKAAIGYQLLCCCFILLIARSLAQESEDKAFEMRGFLDQGCSTPFFKVQTDMKTCTKAGPLLSTWIYINEIFLPDEVNDEHDSYQREHIKVRFHRHALCSFEDDTRKVSRTVWEGRCTPCFGCFEENSTHYVLVSKHVDESEESGANSALSFLHLILPFTIIYLAI